LSATLRLFVALWPPPAVRDAIAAWQAAWTWPARTTPVKPERLHLTLHFLGDVAAPRVPEVERALGRVPFAAFMLRLREAQTWGAGIAVLHPGETPAGLRELHTQVGLALADVGLPLEQRPYRPHVTLARRAAGATPPSRGPDLEWKVESGFVLARTLGGGQGYAISAPFGLT
jgi:RNA 2',3'-cyclic 3'-phosphodiesterase